MADEQQPFADVVLLEGGFSLPELKWRELLFVGALRREGDCFTRDPTRPLLFIGALRADGGGFVRDPSRALPPFRLPGLFPDGVLFRVTREAGRVVVRPAGP